MRLLYTRNWYATARRPGCTGPIVVEVDYSDSMVERAAWMTVDAAGMQVREARWEEYRRQDGCADAAVHEVPGLVGVEAYFDCGKAIARALPDDADGSVSDLFKEGVKVLIQAEPLFLEERGYVSLDDYQTRLFGLIQGSCYYLALPDRNLQTVRDKFQFHHRKENFFSRHRSLFLYEEGEEYRVLGTISDGWHEMQVDVSAGKDTLRISRAEATFVRVPDEECRHSAPLFGRLVGCRLDAEGTKQLLGAAQGGCTHLTDLVREATRALQSPWVRNAEGARWPRRGGGKKGVGLCQKR